MTAALGARGVLLLAVVPLGSVDKLLGRAFKAGAMTELALTPGFRPGLLVAAATIKSDTCFSLINEVCVNESQHSITRA